MGCNSSKSVDSKANRAARWRSTGIVGLRDSKLKAISLSLSLSPIDMLDFELDNCFEFELMEGIKCWGGESRRVGGIN